MRSSFAMLAAAMLAACSGSDAPTSPQRPAGPAPAWQGAMATAGNTRVILLDRTPVSLTFPATSLSPAERAGDFAVTPGPLVEHTEGAHPYWTAPLPMPAPEQRKGKPDGLRVEADGARLPFVGGDPAQNPGKPGWRLLDGDLVVYGPTRPTSVRLIPEDLADYVRRLDPSSRPAPAEGVDPAGTDLAYAAFSFTRKGQTRSGLLLPAPAAATWRVSLPQGARLRTWASVITVDWVAPSDGARVIVEVDAGDGYVQAGNAAVPVGDDARVEVDLSRWSGQEVTLRVRTDGGASSLHDWVHIAAPTVVGTPSGPPRHVLVVGIDTTRPDHFGVNGYEKDTTPELDAWSKQAVIFDRAWTSAPRTRPSFRAATTGRLPLDAVCARNIGDVFDANGFATAGIVSNIHLNPRFDFDKGYDFWWLDGKALVDDQIKRAKDWLAENGDRDTFMFLHIMDPHIFYRAPQKYIDKFVGALPPLPEDQKIPKFFNRWGVYKWDKAGKLSDLRKQHIEALYDAELAWTSTQLAAFLADYEAMAGEKLVIIHNDHGEEFWEHGGFEHNHTLYQDVTAGLLWVKPPGGVDGGGARSAFPTTLQDIAPTVYEFAGLQDVPPTDGQSLWPAIRGAADAGWTRPIPVAHLQYDANRWGVVWQDHKYVLHTGTGEEELYDLVADPGERNNLAGATDTTPYWKALGEANLLQIGRGWRISVDAAPSTTWTVTLPAMATAADVMDPELIVKHPANLEFGEKPHKLPSEVGAVKLSPDQRTLTFTAGSSGKGTLYVLFGEEPVDPAGAQVSVGDATGTLGGAGATTPKGTMSAAPGIVFVPPASETERMKACESSTGMSPEMMRMLRELGYVHSDADEAEPEGDDEAPAPKRKR